MPVPVNELVTILVAILIESTMIHFAAGLILGGSRFLQAFGVATIGSLLGALIFLLLGGVPILAFIVVLLAWLSICATIYRTNWLRALLIGVLAYILWVLTKLVVDALLEQIRKA